MNRPKVLAVDDKPQNLFALEQLLRRLPVEVVRTTSPVEALALTLEHDFCMVVVDVQMPEMDGYELVSLLRSNHRTARMPVIFVSAIYSDDYHHRRGYESGAVDFLSKPFVPEILISKVKVFLDLYTQRKELDDLVNQLKEANQRLSELNVQKDRLIGLTAHDLRNPLGNIRGFSELLMMRNGEISADEKAIVTEINKQSDYMLALIDDLLDVSQIETGSLNLRTETVNVAVFLQELVGQHHRLAHSTKGSSVTLEEVPSFRAELDPYRLRQVIDNLITNAVKYSAPGSHTVAGVRQARDQWQFFVRDEGPGIPPEEQAQLFDYFCNVSTMPTGGERSTGLGLAISARVVQAHGGEIGVDSRPGDGSTFWFSLPYRRENGTGG